jgi:hypothetical protein
MDRTYKLKHLANKGKRAKVIQTDRLTEILPTSSHDSSGGAFMRSPSLSIGDAISSISTLRCPSDSNRLVSIR